MDIGRYAAKLNYRMAFMKNKLYLKNQGGKKNYALAGIILAFALLIIGVFVIRPFVTKEPVWPHKRNPTIITTKKVYKTNETVVIKFYNISGQKEEWISIAAEGSSSRNFLKYSWTGGRKNGTIAFRSLRLRPGSYEARLHYSWETRSYAIRKRCYFRMH
jgi:hypothetical protein